VSTHVAQEAFSIHRFTFEDVVAMDAAGILDDHRRELVDGVLWDMNPPGPRHIRAVAMLAEHFVVGVRGSLWVRVQDAILTPDGGWRSPDLLVIPREDGERIADTALLVVEVASSSRARDVEKAEVYAALGVAEYWIVDVDRDEVLVHREPADGAYANVARVTPGDSLTPLIDVPPVDVAALLAR
jgi:Uma2 family endonuclease